jgi:predicted PurR-regulated permease PerM
VIIKIYKHGFFENSMDKDKLFRYFFVFFLAITLYLAYLILAPYFGYIILAMILTFSFNPIYVYLLKKTKSKNMAATIVVVGVLIIFVIPCFFILTTLIKQTASAITAVSQSNFVNMAQDFFHNVLNIDVDMQSVMEKLTLQIKDSLVGFSLTLISTVSDMLLGLFITFFIMFYGLKSGDELLDEIKTLIPLHDRYKNKFFEETRNLTYAVIYGQVITSLAQGLVGGLGFWIFGVPNPVFWGVIMVIFGFLPFVGTPMIWAPAVIYKIMQHDYGMAIGLLLYSAILTTNIDNALRPFVISNRTKLHPVLVILGVFGGLSVFGFMGIIIGPIILAILVIFLQEYTIDFKSTLVQKEEAREEAKEEKALEAAMEKELEKEESKAEKQEKKEKEKAKEEKKDKKED